MMSTMTKAERAERDALLLKRIRALRATKGWSQYDIAKELGITQTKVSRLERRARAEHAALLRACVEAGLLSP
jgi:transcriptional regulator with XRE-family HTH domain